MWDRGSGGFLWVLFSAKGFFPHPPCSPAAEPPTPVAEVSSVVTNGCPSKQKETVGLSEQMFLNVQMSGEPSGWGWVCFVDGLNSTANLGCFCVLFSLPAATGHTHPSGQLGWACLPVCLSENAQDPTGPEWKMCVRDRGTPCTFRVWPFLVLLASWDKCLCPKGCLPVWAAFVASHGPPLGLNCK